jgi:RHS repeat-associated protein
LTSATRGTITKSYAYDSLTRLKSFTESVDGESFEFDYDYDLLGRLLHVSYPSAPNRARFVTENVYANWGSLLQVRDGTTSLPIWTAQQADAEGHVTAEQLGNGLTTSRNFDPATGLLTNIATPGIPAYPQNLQYGYSNAGRLTSRSDGSLSKLESFGYDSVGRLASTSIAGGPSATYAYDAIGNMTSSGDYLNACTLQYGGALLGPHQLAKLVCQGYSYPLTYDANGNTLTSSADLMQASWTAFDKASEIENAYGRQRFSYDADHVRVKMDTIKTWSQGNPPYSNFSGTWGTVVTVGDYERRSGPAMATIDHVFTVRAGGRPVAELLWRWNGTPGTDAWRYLHTDRQGSIERTTDSGGNAVEWASYDAFGLERSYTWDGRTWAPMPETRLGYTGHRDDNGLGLINMGGRIYHPGLKRFLSADPVVQAPLFGPSWNRYSYVFNDPLNHTDPSGYSACDQDSGSCGDDQEWQFFGDAGGGGGDRGNTKSEGPNKRHVAPTIPTAGPQPQAHEPFGDGGGRWGKPVELSPMQANQKAVLAVMRVMWYGEDFIFPEGYKPTNNELIAQAMDRFYGWRAAGQGVAFISSVILWEAFLARYGFGLMAGGGGTVATLERAAAERGGAILAEMVRVEENGIEYMTRLEPMERCLGACAQISEAQAQKFLKGLPKGPSTYAAGVEGTDIGVIEGRIFSQFRGARGGFSAWSPEQAIELVRISGARGAFIAQRGRLLSEVFPGYIGPERLPGHMFFVRGGEGVTDYLRTGEWIDHDGMLVYTLP